MKKGIHIIALLLTVCTGLSAQHFITYENEPGAFPFFINDHISNIYTDAGDDWLVKKAATLLQGDIEKVTGKKPDLVDNLLSSERDVIIIGTCGRSSLIRDMADSGKLDISSVKGHWESYKIQVVERPFPGINKALVIVGSDKRGAAYGAFEVSKQIGVSPWYWWADVPVKTHPQLYVKKGTYFFQSPKVKYRGIFINDEAPSFTGWAKEKFGGVNHQVYEKMFELLLRLKANYLWPAMWGNAFNDDDDMNADLADKYGIVMGTSHHEPMLRAQQEWKRYGKGAWNYETNDSVLRSFWRQGIVNMKNHESIVTIGMRGDGDKPMTESTATTLLEKIVADQRKILQDVTGKPAAATPQLWALYKEVQDYYDKGMRVPDDVTLLLCDDNWGNIRRLPAVTEKKRAGGYGIYYHFDYVGDPRNYKWVNTNQVSRVWEQMHLAYQRGVDRIWIVNVGDLKPMEFPISFFLDYAWNPDAINASDLNTYTYEWAVQQFGPEYAANIARILTTYSKYNSRRKPELLSPDTYSLTNYQEFEKVVADYDKLDVQARQLYDALPVTSKDAYYQLVLYPVEACSNLYKLNLTVAKNRVYAKQGRAATNSLANAARSLFAKDALLAGFYNKIMSGGKWDHMMDQTHISYTYWQQPEKDVMPEVQTINLPVVADMGVAIEGSETVWPGESGEPELPESTPYQQDKQFIDVFDRGDIGFDFKASTTVPWLQLSSLKGHVEIERRIWLSVNWQSVPLGKHRVPITITASTGKSVVVYANINKPVVKTEHEVFVESNGYISIEAEHYAAAVDTLGAKWVTIPDLGRTLSGVTAMPVTLKKQSPDKKSARLQYAIYSHDAGDVKVAVYLSPTLDFNNNGGLQYGISIDDEQPQIINMHKDSSNKNWQQSVADNIKIITSQHHISQPGEHVLNFWLADTGVVLQKIVVDFGGVKQSYLGPPETLRK